MWLPRGLKNKNVLTRFLMDNCFIGNKIWCPRTIVVPARFAEMLESRRDVWLTCGVQQSVPRLDDLDQRPCVSQHSNFIEISLIAANY